MPQALEMCKMARQDGVSVICATPHYNDYYPLVDVTRSKRLTRELNQVLARENIPLKIVPGLEIRVYVELEDLLGLGRLMGLGDSNTLLLEFHPSIAPAGFDKLARIIIDKGFSILIAHPEKNLAIQDIPESLFFLMRDFEPWKVMSQITASSITGENGIREKRTARILMEHNLAHVIASDAHDDKLRTPIMSAGVESAEKIVGVERARQMVSDIPRSLLDRTCVFPEWSNPTNPRKWWRIF